MEEEIVKICTVPPIQRNYEVILEIMNRLSSLSFVQQLDVQTKAKMAKSITTTRIAQGGKILLSSRKDPDKDKRAMNLYLVISGSFRVGKLPLFRRGDTFGFCGSAPKADQLEEQEFGIATWPSILGVIPYEQCQSIFPKPKELAWAPEAAKYILKFSNDEVERTEEELVVALEIVRRVPLFSTVPPDLQRDLGRHVRYIHADTGQAVFTWEGATSSTIIAVLSGRLELQSVLMDGERESIGIVHSREHWPANVRVRPAASGAKEWRQLSKQKSGASSIEDKAKAAAATLARVQSQSTHGSFVMEEPSKAALRVEAVSQVDSTEVLIIDRQRYYDIVFPPHELQYNLENCRKVLRKFPHKRRQAELNAFVKDLMLPQPSFLQFPLDTCFKIARKMVIETVEAGDSYVEEGEEIPSFFILLSGSFRYYNSDLSQTGAATSGDVFGMLTTFVGEGAKSPVTLRASGTCEVVVVPENMVKSVERRKKLLPLPADAIESLKIDPKERSAEDITRLLSAAIDYKSPLNPPHFRHLPYCLKKRMIESLELRVFCPFSELLGVENLYVMVLSGSVSIHAITPEMQIEAERHLEPPSMQLPSSSILMAADIGNFSLRNAWKKAKLGPCAAVVSAGGVLGQYIDSQEPKESSEQSGKGDPSPSSDTTDKVNKGSTSSRRTSNGVSSTNQNNGKDDEELSWRCVTRETTELGIIHPKEFRKRLLTPCILDQSLGNACLALHSRASEVEELRYVEREVVLDVIRAVPFLSGLPISCQIRLCGHLQLMHFEEGEIVTQEANYGKKLYIILEGIVQYHMLDKSPQLIQSNLARECGFYPRKSLQPQQSEKSCGSVPAQPQPQSSSPAEPQTSNQKEGFVCLGAMGRGDFWGEDLVDPRHKKEHVKEGSYFIRCEAKASILVLKSDHYDVDVVKALPKVQEQAGSPRKRKKKKKENKSNLSIPKDGSSSNPCTSIMRLSESPSSHLPDINQHSPRPVPTFVEEEERAMLIADGVGIEQKTNMMGNEAQMDGNQESHEEYEDATFLTSIGISVPMIPLKSKTAPLPSVKEDAIVGVERVQQSLEEMHFSDELLQMINKAKQKKSEVPKAILQPVKLFWNKATRVDPNTLDDSVRPQADKISQDHWRTVARSLRVPIRRQTSAEIMGHSKPPRKFKPHPPPQQVKKDVGGPLNTRTRPRIFKPMTGTVPNSVKKLKLNFKQSPDHRIL